MTPWRISYKAVSMPDTHHILTVNCPWRMLPCYLDKVRAIPMDIRCAHVAKNTSTLYLHPSTLNVNMNNIPLKLGELADIHSCDLTIHDSSGIRLPVDTQILMYNNPVSDYTTMEFGCDDRTGLLCDLLVFMQPLSVDILDGFVTTLNGMAHNIFHLQKNNKQLSDLDISYIYNVFEHDAKNRLQSNTNSLM